MFSGEVGSSMVQSGGLRILGDVEGIEYRGKKVDFSNERGKVSPKA